MFPTQPRENPHLLLMFAGSVPQLLSRMLKQRTESALSGCVCCCRIFLKAAENVTLDGLCYVNPKLLESILGLQEKKKRSIVNLSSMDKVLELGMALLS